MHQGKKRRRKGGDCLLPNLLNHSRRLEYSLHSQVTTEDKIEKQVLGRNSENIPTGFEEKGLANARLGYCS